ncbi:uncharacterized protein LOC134252017 [Saccostrea cucullata]|uniref:uncharacterized protein LOC134252017 n=1 Tax=Saccostrea cuccullata TaxID=36930 RepID=UPI002ED502C7
MKVIFWITIALLPMVSFGKTQMLTTEHPMVWHDADKICHKKFNGTGYRHLAGDIPDTTMFYSLQVIKDYESFWLDNIAYDLGCRDGICSHVIERHRRFLSHDDLPYLCQDANGEVTIRKYCGWNSNILNVTYSMIGKLRQEISRFLAGEEFIVNSIALNSTEVKCTMARKHGQEFRRMYTKCNEFHKALCEHDTSYSIMVSTVEYREIKREYQIIFTPHSAESWNSMKDREEDSTDSTGFQEIIWTSLSIAVVVMAFSVCIGGIIFCKRKNIKMDSVYDTIFMRPRGGGNRYTIRIPTDPNSPISEPANHLLPTSQSVVRNPTPTAPTTRNPTSPPRVDSVQTLASSTLSSADTSSSYVDDVRYYRNFSYETPPSVAPSEAPRIEIQPSAPAASTSGSTSGRLYCSSCRRHRRRRDFQRTSSNCTSCSSVHSAYTQPSSRLAERNVSLDTNDSSSLRSQRSSRDTNDTNSMRSHRSHRSKRSHHHGLSKKSRHKVEEEYFDTGQIATPGPSTETGHESGGSNNLLRKHKLVDRIQTSSGFRMVKRMFSVDLK